MFGECIKLRLESAGPFKLDVLLVSHLNQEGFHPGETPGDWLHDGGDDGRNDGGHDTRIFSTTDSFRFRHSGTLLADVGSPVFYFAHFILNAALPTLVSASATCNGSICADGQLWYAAGPSSVIVDAVTRLSRASWLLKQGAPAARRLLDVAAMADPGEVGRPFDVLAITKGGASWSHHDPASACKIGNE